MTHHCNFHCWPSYIGVVVNESASELANIGSDMAFHGPEPVIGIPYSTLINKIDIWCSDAHYNYLSKNQKKLEITVNSDISKKLWTLNRTQLGFVIDSPICQCCNMFAEETIEHF